MGIVTSTIRQLLYRDNKPEPRVCRSQNRSTCLPDSEDDEDSWSIHTAVTEPESAWRDDDAEPRTCSLFQHRSLPDTDRSRRCTGEPTDQKLEEGAEVGLTWSLSDEDQELTWGYVWPPQSPVVQRHPFVSSWQHRRWCWQGGWQPRQRGRWPGSIWKETLRSVIRILKLNE